MHRRHRRLIGLAGGVMITAPPSARTRHDLPHSSGGAGFLHRRQHRLQSPTTDGGRAHHGRWRLPPWWRPPTTTAATDDHGESPPPIPEDFVLLVDSTSDDRRRRPRATGLRRTSVRSRLEDGTELPYIVASPERRHVLDELRRAGRAATSPCRYVADPLELRQPVRPTRGLRDAGGHASTAIRCSSASSRSAPTAGLTT